MMFGRKSTFFKAIADGDVETVKKMLTEGVNPNTFKLFRDSPLNEACARGHVEMAKCLIEAGADINNGAPNRAAEGGHTRLLRLLIQLGADTNKSVAGVTPLHVAAMFKQPESIEVLLQAGARVNERGLHGRTPLYWAVQEGSLEAVRKLLNANADLDLPDNQGDTPLISVGILFTNSEMMVELIDAGADMRPRAQVVNAQREEVPLNLETRDSDKNTLLMIAAKDGRLRAVERLISAGVDLNKTNNQGCTALMLASINGHADVVRCLEQNGAPTVNSDGERAAEA